MRKIKAFSISETIMTMGIIGLLAVTVLSMNTFSDNKDKIAHTKLIQVDSAIRAWGKAVTAIGETGVGATATISNQNTLVNSVIDYFNTSKEITDENDSTKITLDNNVELEVEYVLGKDNSFSIAGATQESTQSALATIKAESKANKDESFSTDYVLLVDKLASLDDILENFSKKGVDTITEGENTSSYICLNSAICGSDKGGCEANLSSCHKLEIPEGKDVPEEIYVGNDSSSSACSNGQTGAIFKYSFADNLGTVYSLTSDECCPSPKYYNGIDENGKKVCACDQAKMAFKIGEVFAENDNCKAKAPKGTYADGNGDLKLCMQNTDTGYYCDKDGLSAPILCPVGYYCPKYEEGKNLDEDNYYKDSDDEIQAEGLIDKVECPAGHYCSTRGLTEPTPCPKGHYCEGGFALPVPCPKGTYQDEMGQTSCKTCGCGKYINNIRTACNNCGTNEYSDPTNNIGCTALADNEVKSEDLCGVITCATEKNFVPNAEKNACVCKEGSNYDGQGNCVVCESPKTNWNDETKVCTCPSNITCDGEEILDEETCECEKPCLNYGELYILHYSYFSLIHSTNSSVPSSSLPYSTPEEYIKTLPDKTQDALEKLSNEEKADLYENYGTCQATAAVANYITTIENEFANATTNYRKGTKLEDQYSTLSYKTSIQLDRQKKNQYINLYTKYEILQNIQKTISVINNNGNNFRYIKNYRLCNGNGQNCKYVFSDIEDYCWKNIHKYSYIISESGQIVAKLVPGNMNNLLNGHASVQLGYDYEIVSDINRNMRNDSKTVKATEDTKIPLIFEGRHFYTPPITCKTHTTQCCDACTGRNCHSCTVTSCTDPLYEEYEGKFLIGKNCSYNMIPTRDKREYVDVSSGSGKRADPVILDLMNNGIKLTTERSGILFDIDGDGKKEEIAWTNTQREFDDAFLVYDQNNNGKIDNGKELFGDEPENGIENGIVKLALHDTNKDNVINKDDEIYDKLAVWCDMNRNAAVDNNPLKNNEMISLEDAGILEISLEYLVEYDKYGYILEQRNSEIGRQGTFKRAIYEIIDGVKTLIETITGKLYDVFFAIF